MIHDYRKYDNITVTTKDCALVLGEDVKNIEIIQMVIQKVFMYYYLPL